ncbi:cobalamin-binding protein [Tistlia consotensis]|uniref:cobalamin-binding protein n=1 Tax=Tistlia consotensis TaxID=1321365 RepID=UPI000A14D031|nr:cobalamin-binding protein [Tistlia consotensis]
MSGPRRVATLVPSATEIVAALGFADRLVARSHECDFPPEIRSLPAVTRSRLQPEASSAEIDGAVRGLLQEAAALYDLDLERLADLRPDLIVTQDQCEVCAVSLAEVEQAAAALEVAARIVSLRPAGLAEVWSDIRRVAEALGAGERGERLVRALVARIEAISERAEQQGWRPGVVCLEWLDPLMGAGNWMPELVALAGGRDLAGEAGHQSTYLDWERLRALDPEVIVLMPCGFDLEQTRREAPTLAARPGWSELQAVARGRVALCDGSRFFNRPGPRLAESLEILAEILHPQAFGFGHQGDGWERLPPPA